MLGDCGHIRSNFCVQTPASSSGAQHDSLPRVQFPRPQDVMSCRVCVYLGRLHAALKCPRKHTIDRLNPQPA